MPRTKTNKPKSHKQGQGGRTKAVIQQMKERQTRTSDIEKSVIWTPDRMVPTGSTMLNLAFSDSIHGGWPLSRISTMPGVSTAGKTYVTMTTLASACQLKRFKDYRLIYDDSEMRFDFDVAHLFGKRLDQRLENPPNEFSGSIQDFSNNLMTLINDKNGRPFLYVLDSLDTLSSDEETEKAYKRALEAAKHPEERKEISGSYNMDKARVLGQTLRIINREIAATNSAVILVQQVRDKIGGPAYGSKYRTSGGNAPFYYSQVRPWLYRVKTLKRQNRKVGIVTEARMEKNSMTGKLRDVQFSIFYDYPGLDDLGSVVDFLIAEKWWPKITGSTKINAQDLKVEKTRADLIDYIEYRNLEEAVRECAQECWDDIEESLRTNRKPRFE